jgi:phosphoribosylglycinamide formyltransferase-1
MQAIVDAAERERWHQRLGGRVAAVISNKAQAPGLEQAQRAGLHTEVIEHRHFESREAFDAALMQGIDRHTPALVVLAADGRTVSRHDLARGDDAHRQREQVAQWHESGRILGGAQTLRG